MRAPIVVAVVLAVVTAACAQEVPTLVLADCDAASQWTAGSLDTTHVKQGKGGLLWEHGKDAAISLKTVPTDWSGYDRLSFWLWTPKASGARFMLIVASENPKTEGADYYSAPITLNFDGWRRFSFYLPSLGDAREPLGWKQIGGLTFTAAGWDNTPNPAVSVVVDDVRLTKEGVVKGPRLSEAELFEMLDLKRPGLADVAKAVAANDLPAAKHALASYYRGRANPKYYIALGEKAQPKVDKPDLTRAERAMRHEMESIGIRYAFGPVIDWNFDATRVAGAGHFPNNEWTWQLNRHPEWLTLSRAYRDTWDEKYAKEFAAQMTQWARDCRCPETSGNEARSAWRTIETGIRAAQIWPELWYRFVPSASLSDDDVVLFLRAYIDHARHLMEHHTTGNWLAMEANGLYHVGALFPEFRDAPLWRETGAKWTYDEMNNQVYPDGVQIELASGYHHVSLGNFLGVFKIARLNELPLPAGFLKRLEKMYDFDVYGALPDRRLPGVQDSDYHDVRGGLREAFTLFPERKDFQWYGTDGKEGTPPAETSHDFPYAGYLFMRSGWEPDARALMLDAGPFGYGHQHEDKLEIIVHAFGQRLLWDPGTYQYESSKWRSYFIDSPSHNVVLVDSQPQRRRGQPREQYVVKQPLPHVWETAADHDYAEGYYDEDFGGAVKRNVSQTRRVLFVKPDYWIVLDTLTAKDGKPHRYDALFHYDAKVAVDGLRVVTQNAGAANLTVMARPDAGLSLKIVEGQEEPVQGWMPNPNISSVHPAPVAIYTQSGQGVTQMLYVLAPSRARQPDPVASVAALDAGGLGAVIKFTDGREHRVLFSGAGPADLSLGGKTGHGRVLFVDQTGRAIVAGTQ